MKTGKKIILILLGALILLIISFFNGYPLIYTDTATYIHSGFTNNVPYDRPLFYGWFLNITSLHRSLWFVVIVQNLIQSFIVFQVCSLFFSSKRLPVLFILSLLFLTLFTGMAWYTNTIMPDFAAPMIPLLIFLLVYTPSLNMGKIGIYSSLLIFTIVLHYSHLLIALVTALSLLVFEWRNIKNRNFFSGTFQLKRFYLPAGLIAFCWLLVPSVNFILDKQFRLSKGSHVFMMAHFVENGSLNKFLKENCSKSEFKDCKLCYYKDSLPSNLDKFMWEKNGVFMKTGGWTNSEAEYKKIISAILSDPKQIFTNTYKSLFNTGIQLSRNDIGSGLVAFEKDSEPYTQIYWRFNDEVNFFRNALQNGPFLRIHFAELNKLNLKLNWLLAFFIIMLCGTGAYKKMNPLSVKLLILLLLFVLINALFTGGITSPSERYQARAVWLAAFSTLIVVISNFEEIKQYVFKLISKSVSYRDKKE